MHGAPVMRTRRSGLGRSGRASRACLGAEVLVLVALGAAGCGSEDDGGAAAGDTGAGGGGGEGAGAGGSTGGSSDCSEAISAALSAFGGCMMPDSWSSHGLDLLASAHGADGSTCADCHKQGDGGVFLSPNPSETFDWHTAPPGLLLLVAGTADAECEIDVVQDNAYLDPSSGHPPYQLDDAIVDGFDGFFADTYACWQALR
jgi:hypothetical protein